MITTIISTIVVLGVLIFVHELGHFLVAKWSGVTVLRFSLGFGPRLITIKRGDTEYCLSLVPLGGYVKMLGEDPDEDVTEEQLANSFGAQPVLRRMGIVLAGPLSNFVLAIVIFTFVFAISGIPQLTTEIGTINPESPAEQAGLQVGDKVLSINDKSLGNWEELSQTIEQSGEQVLNLRVQRGEEIVMVSVSPRVSEVKNLFGEAVKRPVIGITASGKTAVKEVNPLMAGYYSLTQTWTLSKLFFMTVVKLIERVVPLQTLGGPILIAHMAGKQAEEGAASFLAFIAFISINLAILNFLPIPVLDGGHLLFYAIEVIRRKPVDMKTREVAQQFGMIVLISLMALVFYNDITRLME